jgi:hypothetical protein
MIVMIPVWSAGSNHVGASVMWIAHVIWDWAAAGSGATATIKARTTTRTESERVIEILLAG